MDPKRARKLLRQEQQRIEDELQRLRRDRAGEGELSPVDQHTADAGTELYEDERVGSMIERLEADLEAVHRAMKRVDDGKYGLSVESGKPIPDERLEIVPQAERTVEEQARLEAQDRNSV